MSTAQNTEPVDRPAPPPLEYRAPDCSICGVEVDHDGDGWRCYSCDASWGNDFDGEDGEWDEEFYPELAEARCAASIEQYGEALQCVLLEDHVDAPEPTGRYPRHNPRRHRHPDSLGGWMTDDRWEKHITGPDPDRLERGANRAAFRGVKQAEHDLMMERIRATRPAAPAKRSTVENVPTGDAL
jgi:hypothetical protein